MKRASLVFLLFGLFLTACKGSTTSGSIEIKDAWARPAITMDMGENSSDNLGEGGMSSGNGAAYMTVVNKGVDTDRLISVESDVADSTELHQTVVQDNVMSMSPVDGLDVPSRGQVELKPGGYHIMLVGLKQDLKLGDMVKLTLVFEKAGKINIEAEVKNP
jgi:copper(I)-binding protein